MGSKDLQNIGNPFSSNDISAELRDQARIERLIQESAVEQGLTDWNMLILTSIGTEPQIIYDKFMPRLR